MIRKNSIKIWIVLLLAAGTFTIYSQVLSHSFLVIDDHLYVTENNYVKNGLSLEGLLWAFSTIHAEFWHPLTWLSLMLDTELFGVSPGGYLLTNLTLHIAGAILLFLLLDRSTHDKWKSAFVAALFAIHPLHVESVAWISERKDVLCGLFWMLTLWQYVGFVENKGPLPFFLVHLFFILGAMAKPMIITLPVVLLLFDLWPLERFGPIDSKGSALKKLFLLIKEKSFLFLIAATSGIVAIVAQYKSAGLADMVTYPMGARFANAIISYTAYIERMFWPLNLSVFYPFPSAFSVLEIVLSLLGLGTITVLSLISFKKYPFLIVGWLWYIITLAPVIGLIKIGDFANADRYTYLPLIGLTIMLAWGAPALLLKLKWMYCRRTTLAVLSFIILLVLSLLTWKQISYWSDSANLFKHALRVTGNNFYVHHSLGNILVGQGKINEAIYHFEQAVELNGEKQTLKNSLARALLWKGRFDVAQKYLEIAINKKPDYSDAHFTLGLVLAADRNYVSAFEHLDIALRKSKTFDDSLEFYQNSTTMRNFRKAMMSQKSGLTKNAAEALKRILKAQPDFLPAVSSLARIYVATGSYQKAFSLFQIQTSLEWLKKAGVRGFDNWTLIRANPCDISARSRNLWNSR